MTAHKRRRTPVSSTGQHFLHDHRLIRKIFSQANINRNHLVLDIGAGKGVLTAPLARAAGRVIAIENDPVLVSRLKRSFNCRKNVTVREDDALNVRFPGEPFRVVSNIPYGITTGLFGKLMNRPAGGFAGGILIIEWGAAKRFAEVCSRDPRVVGWNTWFDLKLICKVKPGSFSPPPGVDSAMVRIRRRANPVVKPERYYGFASFVASMLEQPGLSASRALRALFTRKQVKRILTDAGINGNAAVWRLTPGQWAHCFNTMDRLLPRRVHPAMPGRGKRWYR